ncbi:hypothetical protein SK128_018254, partial [Halocaridina rubra]
MDTVPHSSNIENTVTMEKDSKKEQITRKTKNRRKQDFKELRHDYDDDSFLLADEDTIPFSSVEEEDEYFSNLQLKRNQSQLKSNFGDFDF